MEIIKISTLIDITNSRSRRTNSSDNKESNQQKNWQTLLQCIGLRCNITYENDPSNDLVDLKNLSFGSKFKGKQRVWTFVFRPDRSDSYKLDDNRVGLLINDLNLVPVIQNLDETINISKSAFITLDPENQNTVVEMLKD
jgi:hypothetical protein